MNAALRKLISRMDPRTLRRIAAGAGFVGGGTGAGALASQLTDDPDALKGALYGGAGSLGGGLAGAGIGALGSLADDDTSGGAGAGMGAAGGVGGIAGGLGGYALMKKLLSKGKL